MIDRINGRIAMLLSACVVLVVVLVGWFVFVSPQRSKAASLDRQIGSTDDQIASTQAYLKSTAPAQSKRELKALERAMPANVQMSQILRQLSAAATRAQVDLSGITPGTPLPSAGGQAVPISLSVQGHYFSLSKFMHILRSWTSVKGQKVRVNGRLYSIDQIGFSGGGTNNILSASISLNAFISTPAAPVVVAPTTTDTTSSP